jgi:endo-1,4-beta-xylanase
VSLWQTALVSLFGILMTRYEILIGAESLSNIEQYSWIPSTFSGQGAACLFDENLNRKPAYYGVVSALSGTTQPVGTASAATATSSSAAKASVVAAVSSSSGMTTSYISLSTSAVTSSASPSVTSQSSVTTSPAPVATSSADVEPEEDDSCDA